MSTGAKVTDLIKGNKFSFSFEITPSVKREDINNLKVEPLFFSVTWCAKTHNCNDLDITPVKIAKYLRSKQKQVLIHLWCDLLRKDFLDNLLKEFQENEICNLFVNAGERYDVSRSDFKSSIEVITYIRKTTGDYFCIGVPGSPVHPDGKPIQLKERIDSGADFIITPPFSYKDVFNFFVKSCKEIGITVPIIPGVFVVEDIKHLKGFIKNHGKVDDDDDDDDDEDDEEEDVDDNDEDVDDEEKEEEADDNDYDEEDDEGKDKVSDDLLKEVEDKSGREKVKKYIQDVTTETDLKHFLFYTLNKLEFVSEFVREFNI